MIFGLLYLTVANSNTESMSSAKIVALGYLSFKIERIFFNDVDDSHFYKKEILVRKKDLIEEQVEELSNLNGAS